MNNLTLLDVRPDRIDVRDRPYLPKLVSLPIEYPFPQTIAAWFPAYAKRGLILDQGNEGACTGFGLAAVVNYLLFRAQRIEKVRRAHPFKSRSVSPAMLYQLARMYDEWEGEDYDGSSCRGAVKGWHKHGVCSVQAWPYQPKKFIRPTPAWQNEAPQVNLGAYYRLAIESASDLQAAIAEVGAVFASASVHDGWMTVPKNASKLPAIKWSPGTKSVGGHAFALVGYTSHGIIVQNSWGANWGWHGFALLTWPDWIANAMDAWVATLGAPFSPPPPSSPKKEASPSASRSFRYLSGEASAPVGLFGTQHPNPYSLPSNVARRYALQLFNDGRLLHGDITFEDAQKEAKQILEHARAWLAARPPGQRRIALYAHGGLNSRAAGLQRVEVMADWFLKNGVYPLFLVWGTGFGDTLGNILKDALPGLERMAGVAGKGLVDSLVERWDSTLEFGLRSLGRPLWSEMKENATRASNWEGGMRWLAAALKEDVIDQVQGTELHLVGHSAGAILLGYFLPHLHANAVSSLHLYAPAASVPMALDTYVPAAEKNVFSWQSSYLYALSDQRERDDTVGPYRKSLLYLVCRSFEDDKSTPLIGMEATWDSKFDTLMKWNPLQTTLLERWRAASATMNKTFVTAAQGVVRTVPEEKTFPWTHGHFDNDIGTVELTLERICGKPIETRILDLTM
jgi:hypothetical protein